MGEENVLLRQIFLCITIDEPQRRMKYESFLDDLIYFSMGL